MPPYLDGSIVPWNGYIVQLFIKHYTSARKSQLYELIFNEVKEEVINAAIYEAEQIINEKVRSNEISENRKLLFEGFILAIFVGLFVNQLTDIIGYFKGTISIDSIWPTTYIAGVFFLICLIIIGGIFICQVIGRIRASH